MTIAEFFVKLGIKGDDEAKASLEGVNNKIKEAGSSALGLKVAILGAMWGLERMMSSSNSTGAGLMQFSNATGMSIKKLQEWKFAAQQANVSGEEMQSGITAMQKSFVALSQGRGSGPEGLGWLQSFMEKNGEKFDVDRAIQDPEWILQWLQKFANNGTAAQMSHHVQSILPGEGIFGAFRANEGKGVFNEKNYAAAPKLNDGQVKSLSANKAAWSNVGGKLENAFNQFVAKHGGGIVGDVSKLADKIILVGNSLMKLGEYLKVFDMMGKSLEGIAILSDIIRGDGKKHGDFSIKGFFDSYKGATADNEEKLKAMGNKDMEAFLAKRMQNTLLPTSKEMNQTVNQNFNFSANDGRDSKKIGSLAEKGAKSAVRTSSGLMQDK